MKAAEASENDQLMLEITTKDLKKALLLKLACGLIEGNRIQAHAE